MRKPDPDYEALLAQPRPILSEHSHEFALMRNREIVEFRASFKEALRAGEQRGFASGEFTVQQVSSVLRQLDAATVRAETAPPRRPDPDYEALMAQPTPYLRSHADQFALMHNQKIIEFYPTFREALTVGRKQYEGGDFTVQQVRIEPVRLGSVAMLMTS
jgi:hypothetical protein